MNNIQLLGRATSDLELKTTARGKSVCSFTLAVDRKYNKDTTDFIPCTIWDKGAEVMSKYVKKGQLIAVDGSLYTRKYQDKDGNNRTAYEVNVNNFYFAESKKSANIDVQPDPLNAIANNLNNAGVVAKNSGSELDSILDGSGDLPW
jgi:single-strand DNA-binding protein|nr:MAG TPA: Single strand binding protein [Caudoviricetes sp.]